MWIAFRFSLLILFLCGVVYPLTMTGLGQAFFPAQASGSLIRDTHGQPVGSALLAQPFEQPGFFHPRPSAVDYNAAGSGGSNDGPDSRKLIDRVRKNGLAYQQANRLAGQTIPADAVTTSGSGLDPHISLENALLQAPRVAMARHVGEASLKQMIRRQSASECGIFERMGHTCGLVNVMTLNQRLAQGVQ